jgi:hypothetical protein
MILTINLLVSTLVFGIAARLYLMPILSKRSPASVLLPILLLHALRHLGLMFLAPGATYSGLPLEFAYPAAFGDVVAAVLALAAIPAVAAEARHAKAMVWVFNVWGSVDLLAAIALANMYDAGPYMGAAYWIPAFWVPTLLVTHGITFMLLRRSWHVASDRRLRSA